MASKTIKWTRKELIEALNLYSRTSFGRIHSRNPEIIELARKLGRSAGAVTLKLANFAGIDPILDRKGFSHCSQLDKQVWDEFFDDVESVLRQDRLKLAGAKYVPEPEGTLYKIHDDEGADRVVHVRMRQQRFRRAILEDYDGKCCVTGLKVEKLLVASHIVPWAKDVRNRVNPHNGLCLNALHDKAFDRGLITIDQSHRVVLSGELRHRDLKGAGYITKTEGKVIRMPAKFRPSQDFLEYHRNEIFVA